MKSFVCFSISWPLLSKGMKRFPKDALETRFALPEYITETPGRKVHFRQLTFNHL